MNKMIKAIEILEKYLMEILRDKEGFIDVNPPLPIKVIEGYSITSIIEKKEVIELKVEFRCTRVVSRSTKFYYLKKGNIINKDLEG